MEGYSSMYNNNPSCWESSSSDPFHSALTSLVSSPDFVINTATTTATTNNNNSLMRELIGRLGTISTSPDPAIDSLYCSAPNSASTSCYSTPLNSPPKLGLSLMERNSRSGRGGAGLGFPATHLPLPADSGFVQRAAMFSCFGGRNVNGGQAHQGGFPGLPLRRVERAESGRFSRVSSSQNLAAGLRNGNSHENMETGDSPEGSSISEQITRPSEVNSSRKRKFAPRGKAKECTKDGEDCTENGQPGEKKRKDDNVKPPEPPKDYIHVRARRGQATDSHSLAERVRREKISQRMKVLQDLVPGCNKVTGKAVMLDEIINYVQALQRQVEFLSMKLATLNPRMDFNADALLSKDMCNPPGSSLFPGDSSSSSFPYGNQMQFHDAAHISKMEDQLPLNALNVTVHPSMDGFCEPSSTTASGLWDDELHSLVQMGRLQNQPQQRLQGTPTDLGLGHSTALGSQLP